MKRTIILAAIIAAALAVSVGAQSKPLVAMTTDTNGLGDGSFNDGVYAGLQRAEKEGLCTTKVVEAHAMTDYVPNLSGLAEDGAKMVFGVGALMIEQIQEAAKSHPDTYFVGIDHWYSGEIPPNLIGISYREQEAGYLAGIVAGYMTKKYRREVSHAQRQERHRRRPRDGYPARGTLPGRLHRRGALGESDR